LTSLHQDVVDVLGSEGRIAKRLKHYEQRPQQLEMAAAVATALSKRQHLIAEAGTGTGKSFAYLVPAILHATANQVEPRGKDDEKPTPRVLVSTHTISLQEQLIAKDIPLLGSVMPREFSAVLVKGRSNYVSLRRLQNAVTRSTALFATDEQTTQLMDINRWAKETHDGSLATLSLKPSPAVWDEVASDTGNCMGKQCRTFSTCHYFQARRRASRAQVLIVNHALFFSDLALRRQGAALLPDYDTVILDECHTLESVAGDHLGIRLTNTQFDYQLNKLYNDRTQKGLLVTHDLQGLQREVDRCRYAVANYFADLLDWQDREGPSNGRVPKPTTVQNPISEPLEQLANRVKHFADSIKDESEKKNFTSASERLLGLSQELKMWHGQGIDATVYWIERHNTRRGDVRVQLAASPIDVGATLRKELFQSEMIKSVIMTSATLAVGQDDKFSFYRSRIGLSGGLSVRVGSPFDYEKQAEVILVNGLPDPSAQRVAYEAQLPAQIKRFISMTDGHAFVLFTSYDLLKRCASSLMTWLAEREMLLLSQAGEQTRSQLLDRFRATPRSVLFGTDSFWQGVDVPGDALQNVIITKLPFSVPDHPLLQARLDAIREGGGNPFRDYQLPEAVIKFRQGFGRLIRRASDHGMVVVLDPRIKTKPYGRTFLESLPKMTIRTVEP
jgi:ATP-dependent DNA helicase DinG